ncbi:MAG TPA: tetratricopeptide repeat protein [Methanoregula sp.]|nr:tetratricopeptide repeat protein [Methanoregula sp.]
MKPAKKKAPEKPAPGKPKMSRYYLAAGAIVAVIIVVAALYFLVLNPPAPETAGSLYTKSVDLANAGQYQQALDAADRALAKNDTALTGVIQANRAGILVMLGNYSGAIEAADSAISIPGNLTETHSIAYFNKGNALKALGRIDEARAAYANATAINPSEFPTPGF